MVFHTSPTFSPNRVANHIAKEFESKHPQPNHNRSRLLGTAKTLTFGAHTGRGSERGGVIKRTYDPKYDKLIQLVHSLAQPTAETALPYLGLQILKLDQGQDLNQHRDYHNHPDYPNHTLNFGKFTGGNLEILRDGAWTSCAKTMVWLSFDALKVVHRVTAVTEGTWYSVTLYTPSRLERLTAYDWDGLGRAEFPSTFTIQMHCR